VNAPSHSCQGSDGCSDQLGCKQIPEFGRWDQQERQLNQPEEQVTISVREFHLVEKYTDLIIPCVEIP
jgi:hypothetical protein